MSTAQRNLEAALAEAQETIRKKDRDVKSLLLSLDAAKSTKQPAPASTEETKRLEHQLEQKDEDYTLLLDKYTALGEENKELRSMLFDGRGW